MSFTKFIVASDIHGDNLDPNTVATFHKFCDQYKPKLRILAGDLWDFRPLRGKATDDEKRESMKADYEDGERFFKRFKPNHFLLGNHDARLWHLRDLNNGVRSDYAADLIDRIETMAKIHKCQILPYHKRDGILRIGSLKVLHGFYAGVYASRQHALIYGSCLYGHVHTIDEHAIPGLERRVARSIGCLCKLDMDYNSTQPQSLRHAHGWAYGVINDQSGEYNVWQAEEIGGKWMLPSDIVEL